MLRLSEMLRMREMLREMLRIGLGKDVEMLILDMGKGWGRSEGLRTGFDNLTMIWMWEKRERVLMWIKDKDKA